MATIEQTPVVHSDRSITYVAEFLRDPDVPAVVVRDGVDELGGIATESDVVALVAERGIDLPVETCCSTPVVTTQPSTPVGFAADRMRDAGVRHLPVVDADDEYHGVVTRDGLASYLSRSRLDITWDGEPLTIDDEPVATGEDALSE